MLPSVLSSQLRSSITEYLRSSFALSNGVFKDMLERFLEEEKAIKGPYLSLGLPFRSGERENWFPQLFLEHTPYLHQEKAFERLSPETGLPLSTIVATGTGSGKTECFLYPIYAHCLKARDNGELGVKAILIYPMNALATDQAERIARFIATRPQLKKIRAGLYVGGFEHDGGSRVMTETSVITNRDTMRKTPPDILITNYKMLDLLLQRIEDRALWRHNAPETLQYLVVDELHTFDGAQGTDLACLIRRLKSRLHTPEGTLCCVGTSATLGDDAGAVQTLINYASDIFGESFTESSIIREARLAPAEFLGNATSDYLEKPSPDKLSELFMLPQEDIPRYLARQYALWFGKTISVSELETKQARIELGEKLKHLVFFQNLVKLLKNEVSSLDPLAERLFPRDSAEYQTAAIQSLLALVSYARNHQGSPLLQVRAQIWLRELSRMVASIDAKPELMFSSDINGDKTCSSLPVVYCRECGSAAWLTMTDINGSTIQTGITKIYQNFFSKTDAQFTLLFPGRHKKETYQDCGQEEVVCPHCLSLARSAPDGECKQCGAKSPVPVLHIYPAETKRCPFCGSVHPWIILGSRSASLTSAVISTLNGSNSNDDKKIITFSDNVQDAAHRAGFFGARTYAPTLRTAFLQCLASLQSPPLLADFPSIFRNHWLPIMGDLRYVATFLPPSMEWFYDYDRMKESGRVPAKLFSDLDKRMEWEIYSAFTFMSGIGRTLEKCGCAVAHVPGDVIRKAAEQLQLLLSNQIDRLRNCGTKECQTFLAGFLKHLQAMGAVFHGEALRTYVNQKGNIYALSKNRQYMPSFTPQHKTPSFLCDSPWVEAFEPVYQSNGKTWCLKWAEKNFPALLGMGTLEYQQIYDAALGLLVRLNIMEEAEKVVSNHRVWGLTRNALQLSHDVQQFRCGKCGKTITVDASEAEFWQDAPCSMSGCNGKFTPCAPRLNFYSQLYRYGSLERLFTAEHTGLLSREAREEVERSFKRREKRAPWDYNLLSCTPTLEMGIDIGDLSSTIQCSVPPSQSNYLQRIGRAGRTDGNALSVTIAEGKPHDLFFFADPVLMMRGAVTPPGIFLNASAVLERQLTAYCMDCWVSSGIPETAIPRDMGKILRTAALVKHRKLKDDKLYQQFPYNFLQFIQLHASVILQNFIAMFDKMTQETQEYLDAFLFGNHAGTESLEYKIVERINVELNESQSFVTRLKKVKDEKKKRENTPVHDDYTKEELKELNREIKALVELHKEVQNKSPFQFLADEGLLPNYAFPEQGVTLHSIIYRKKNSENSNGDDYDSQAFSYQRSAQNALRELAPGSKFYAGKRRVEIQQVDIRTSAVQKWRICPDCSHMEMDTPTLNGVPCPKCGSPMFGDSGQIREMLKMSQVFANTSDKKSRVDDSSENREPQFYVTQMLLEYDAADQEKAWKLDTDECLFAYTYLRKATFREINFGETVTDSPFSIAGLKIGSRGFCICAQCGCILPEGKSIPEKHEWGCPARKPDAVPNLYNCLYIYREFNSEALKILLPFSDEYHTSALESFIAAFSMGMKLRFGGTLQHLHPIIHREPDAHNHSLRKQFLVIYDTVPGGTGYLKQLAQKDTLFEILEEALKHLEQCSCEEVPDHDGCYRCLRAYRNSAHSALISKHEAIETLRPLLKHKNTLKEISNFDDISTSSLFESELEKKFIEALRRSTKEYPIHLEKQLLHGKPVFLLEIGKQHWIIEQQVDFDQKDGVEVPCRADFVFRPPHSQDTKRPVVVFTDGFTWHKDRIAKDIEQRLALLHSRKYLTWSLCWNDIEAVFKEEVKNKDIPEIIEPNSDNDSINKAFEKIHADKRLRVTQKSSLELLLRYLASPDESAWAVTAKAYAILSANKKLDSELKNKVACLPEPLRETALPQGALKAACREKNFLQKYASLSRTSDNCLSASVVLRLDDAPENLENASFQNDWQAFLRGINLFQFLPAFAATAASCKEEDLLWLYIQPEEPPQKYDEEWKAVAELIDDEVRPLLQIFFEKKAPVPEVGLDISDERGRVFTQLELAWPRQQVGIYLDIDDAAAEALRIRGWKAFHISDALADINTIMPLLGV